MPIHEGSEQFDWAGLVPLMVNPMKVTVIEVLHFMGQSLSASEISKMLDVHLSLASYYITTLADLGILEKVGERPVRGATEKFYFFAPRD